MKQTQDKETNTECVFIPEQGKQRKLSAAGVAPGAIHDDKNSIVIKRSQTFSPSAAVSKNSYICRVSFEKFRRNCHIFIYYLFVNFVYVYFIA